jgi:fatty acid desaturase
MSGDIVELKNQLKDAGVLLDDRSQPMFYMVRLGLNGAICLALFLSLPYMTSAWLVALNAIFMAFFQVQCIIIGHDSMHKQLFRRSSENDLVSLFIWNFMSGISHTWFHAYHTKHHVNSNRIGVDPNLEVPFAMTGRDEIEGTTGFRRLYIKYQVLFFIPFLFLSGGDFLKRTMKFIPEMKAGLKMVIELVVMLVHYLIFLGLPFLWLPLRHFLLYVIILYGLAGFYAGMVFATNHFGMPIFTEDEKVSYIVQQTTSSRNIKSSPLIDWVFGGLNFQIEHHLFPTIPRYHLYTTQKIVKTYCQTHELPYHEPTLSETFREMFSYLHGVGAPLRGH